MTDLTDEERGDFWQAIMDTGYLMEGEKRAFEREHMKALAERLDSWLAAHPEVRMDGPLDHFAMHAVRRLVKAFSFNDECGANEPDFKRRLRDSIVKDIERMDDPAARTRENLS